MSRIGRQPVELPAGVSAELAAGVLNFRGPLGEISLGVHPAMLIEVGDRQVVVRRPSDQKKHRALHGLTRSLIQNSVTGVSQGFRKKLEIVGVGYKAGTRGETLTMSLGYSHEVRYRPATGVNVTCPNPTTIVVEGVDKQKVGQAAADIRAFKPPEPYKGKGIRYEGEHVRRKAGKTAARS